MRKQKLWMTVLVLLSGLVLAHFTPVLAAGKTHDFKGEVLAVDLQAQKLSFKDEKGATQTVPVLKEAQVTLKTLKAGDKVLLTCTDNEKGEHQGISAIKILPAGGE
jgi:c-di-GMP-binding flagellar brake protein YcgR